MSKATFEEVVAACPGCNVAVAEDSMFVTDQLRKGATVAQASAEWTTTLKARVEAARQQQETPGVDPLAERPGGSSGRGSSGNEFFARVAQYEAQGMTRSAAVSRVVREDPELQQEMIREANEGRRR